MSIIVIVIGYIIISVIMGILSFRDKRMNKNDVIKLNVMTTILFSIEVVIIYFMLK